MRNKHGNLPQRLILGFLCNSNPISEYTEGKRATVSFSSFLHIEEREAYIRMTSITFWRTVRQYRLAVCSRKSQDITYFLLKYFKNTNEKIFWRDECPKWYVSESAFWGIKRESDFYFFPPFTSSSQVLWFSLFPYPIQRNPFNHSKPFFSRYFHLPFWKPAWLSYRLSIHWRHSQAAVW